MKKKEKAVVRLLDGTMAKGHLINFSPCGTTIKVEEAGAGKLLSFDIENTKAVFFVRSFEGNRAYKEKKAYGAVKVKGNRVFIKFRDGESAVGFLEGDVPWDKGFFLSKRQGDVKGFFILPVDEDANNKKIFVVYSAVADVTVVPLNSTEKS